MKGLIAFGMIASVLIGAALGLIIALFRQTSNASFASADRSARVNETAVGITNWIIINLWIAMICIHGWIVWTYLKTHE